MPEPLPLPRYPLLILTPRPTDPNVHQSEVPTATARLLERLVRRILNSSADYSVTYSPLLCPQGPNWLYTLKPYYWNVDGKWVQRDGQRNPYCDKPQGQNQLQELSLSIRSLSLGAKHLPDLSRECTTKAETLLRTFFMHPSTRMEPEVLYAQCMPGEDPLRGDQAFVIAIRYLIMVTQCLPLLTLPADLDTALRDWFGRQVNWCRSSPQGEKARNYGNNITIWYHAIVASHLSYLDEEESIAYSLITCEYLRKRYPSPQSFFARELSRTRPRHYTLFTLEPTFILAECSSPRNKPPPADILSWLQSLVRFAAEVAPSEIEVEIEAEPRYTSKLAWFEAMLRIWEGGSKGDPPDASGWEGGWNQTARLSWDFL